MRRAMAVLALAMVPAGADVAEARRGELATYAWRLSSQEPGRPTGVAFSVAFHTAGSVDRKSSPVEEVVLRVPAGLRWDTGAAPECTADATALRLLGTAACPPGSEVGRGTYTAMTGLGAPVDPFRGDNHVFNAPGALIEVVTVPGTGVSPGHDRFTIEGRTLTGAPPSTPGGPPDGRTATRTVEFTIPAYVRAGRSLVTTPPRCPRSRRWRSAATFAFADGRRETVVSRTRCQRRPLRRRGTS